MPLRSALTRDWSFSFEAILRVSCGDETLFAESHEILTIMADCWDDIRCVPTRSDVTEDAARCKDYIHCSLGVGAGEVYVANQNPGDVLGAVWPVLIACAANDADVSDSSLRRFIKDAVDNGVPSPHEPPEDEDEETTEWLKTARKRLGSLFERGEWRALPSTKKEHTMRPVIDRRYEGPKHLRTRVFSDYFPNYYYSSQDSSDEDCPPG